MRGWGVGGLGVVGIGGCGDRWLWVWVVGWLLVVVVGGGGRSG